MKGEMLTTKSTIMCPHGGQAILITTNAKVLSRGMPALIETDVHAVVGCPFTLGTKYSPCVRIEWKAGHSDTMAGNVPVLSQQSTGKCINSEGAPQGIATIESV